MSEMSEESRRLSEGYIEVDCDGYKYTFEGDKIRVDSISEHNESQSKEYIDSLGNKVRRVQRNQYEVETDRIFKALESQVDIVAAMIGKKHDSGKLRYSLLPSGTIKQIVEVLEHGAKKYDVNNWQNVSDSRTRYYNALMRHLEAWWNGEKLDPESGCHHLAHAGCCVLFLLWRDNGHS